MELNRRSFVVYGLLAAIWALVLAWQAQEHHRLENYARNSLRNRSKEIASTLGAFIRGLDYRGAVVRDRLQPVLDEMVIPETNDVFRTGEVLSVALLNAAGEIVISAGRPIDFEQKEILSQGERWGRRSLVVVFPVEGATVTNVPVLLPERTNATGRPFRRDGRPGSPGDRPPPPPELASSSRTNAAPLGPRDGNRPSRPFWARGLNDQEYQALIQKRELHGLVLAMSTATYEALTQNDVRMRSIIAFFASLAMIGSGLAWRNLAKSSELQIRLIRASELNSHLKEMNLAAAGLAHETRNPLNIIRGLGQMISRQTEASPEVRGKASDIINEADKVAAQLNEFINYSRPREVRRTALSFSSTITEVVRALKFDLEEKKIDLQIVDTPITVAADEQLFRQALFNLLLNATQAVDPGGHIQVSATRANATEAVIEIRDDGPGIPASQRTEIFKPYFTTHKTGTGLGLAVVQQIVLAHGWEIECLPNEPKGAMFRVTHVQIPPAKKA